MKSNHKNKAKLIFILLTYLVSNMSFAEKIDVEHLALNLKFDWQKKQAIGVARITLSLTSETNKVNLDAAMLTIKSVVLNGKELKYTYNIEKSDLEIILDKQYNSMDCITLEISYHTNHENRADPNAIWGSFGKGLRFQEPTSTTPKKRKQIWSCGEPTHNKYWFPCHESIADIHTSELIATVAKPLMVISNGDLVETIENNDNTRTFHYKTKRPFSNYLISLVVGEYTVITQKTNTISVDNFGYPDEQESVKATTELLPDMIAFMEDKTGYQYPYTQYSQVVVQDYPFPGLVGQNTTSILSDNYIDDHGVHYDFKYLWDGIAVQALANQWFGNLIMPKSWDDIWLNNAFAQYFAGLYTEKNNSKTEYLSYILPFEKATFWADWNSENKHPIVTNEYTDLGNFTNDSYSKYKGALVLRLLQKEVGEENWWKIIKHYVNVNAHKQVTTKDFQKAVETITKESYQWFFDQWIYKIGLPKFEISKTYNDVNKQINISVKQLQGNDSISNFEKGNLFRGKIEMEIDNKIVQANLEAKPENNFTFPMQKAPSFVHFNFEETWICETTFESSQEEYLQQLIYSKDVLAKQKAIDKLVEIVNDSSTSKAFKEKVISTLKDEISSEKYWRYRVYALGSLRKIISAPYDQGIIEMLLRLIVKEESWMKASAIFSLGNTNDKKYASIYIESLNDKSDRVINAAAIALGKTKHPKAFETLIKLADKPSWKNQSRISALNGLEQLMDTRATDFILKCLADNQSPRWYLGTAVWDYPYAAANTLVALGKGALGFTLLFDRFKTSLSENDLNDIFQNIQLIAILKDERGKEMYDLLKVKFKNDPVILETVNVYEAQFLENLKVEK